MKINKHSHATVCGHLCTGLERVVCRLPSTNQPRMVFFLAPICDRRGAAILAATESTLVCAGERAQKPMLEGFQRPPLNVLQTCLQTEQLSARAVGHLLIRASQYL